MKFPCLPLEFPSFRQDIRFRTHLLRGPGRVYRFLPRSASGDDPDGHLPWMYFYDPRHSSALDM